mmetsp:Transcript_7963/g.26060  ORF Transcript_7963/g.26060 Transcript_7963/m.26060 type:complete len:224 (+) Transcript_7963:1225-1896(+)
MYWLRSSRNLDTKMGCSSVTLGPMPELFRTVRSRTTPTTLLIGFFTGNGAAFTGCAAAAVAADGGAAAAEGVWSRKPRFQGDSSLGCSAANVTFLAEARFAAAGLSAAALPRTAVVEPLDSRSEAALRGASAAAGLVEAEAAARRAKRAAAAADVGKSCDDGASGVAAGLCRGAAVAAGACFFDGALLKKPRPQELLAEMACRSGPVASSSAWSSSSRAMTCS